MDAFTSMPPVKSRPSFDNLKRGFLFFQRHLVYNEGMSSLPIVLLLSLSSVISPASNCPFSIDDIPKITAALNSRGLASFESSEVEFFATMKGESSGQYLYVDLAGDNGYLVFNEDWALVFWDDHGDISAIRDGTAVFTFELNSFRSEKGEFVFPSSKAPNRDGFVPGSIAQLFPGFIEYNDIGVFLSDKYDGYDWELYSSGKLPGLYSGANCDGYTEYVESVYIYNSGNGTIYGEGNCGLVSISNGLKYYNQYGSFCLLPNYLSTTWISPYHDEIGLVFAAAANTPSYTPKSDPTAVHSIYAAVRAQAIDVGYVVSGTNDYQTGYAYSGAASQFGYTGTFTPYSTFTTGQIANEINLGHPLQLRVLDDIKYEGHGMMVTGYRFYRAEDWIQVGPNLSLLVYYTAPFVSVFDGFSSDERWYDLTCFCNLGFDYARASAQTFATLHLEETDE